MTIDNRSREELLSEVEDLRFRLEEAEETLAAIQSGAVDALVVSRPEGERIFTLEGAEHPYRVLVESMNEGAATLAYDGTILYCNKSLAAMLQVPLEKLIGTRLASYVASADQPFWAGWPESCYDENEKVEITLIRNEGDRLPVLFSCCSVTHPDCQGMSVVLTDISAQKKAEEEIREAQLQARVAEERERALAVFRESERKFSIIFHETPIAKSLTSFPDGTIYDVNEAWLELTGFAKKEEVIGKTIEDLGLVQESEAWEKIKKEFLRKGSVRNVELEVRDGTGAWRILLVDLRLVDIGGRAFILSTNLDITERKAAESALERANEELERRVDDQTRELKAANELAVMERQRLFDVLEALPAMVCLMSPDYHVPFANKSFRDRFGEPRGRRCFEFCFGKTEPCDFCESFNVLKTGKPHHWEVRDLDGSVISAHDFPFRDVDGSPLILEMDIDITDHRRAEEALKRANAYNRSLIEASLDPLVTIGYDGKIMDVNSATENATGLTRTELIGTDFCDYFSEPDKAREGYEQVFRESSVRDYPLELRHRDGHLTPVLYNAAVYRDASGDVIGLFAAARDITQLKQAESALKYLNATLEQRVAERTVELRRSEKALKASLHEKEVLLKEIHHRVKNNMQVISSLVSLQADGSSNETVREILRDVTYRVRSMALVHEKLYRSQDLASIDFADYARSLLNSLWRSHGAVASSVRLDFDLQTIQLPVDIAVPCGLMLNELAGNTLKHAFNGRSEGNVSISLRKDNGGRVILTVADDGIGLPPDCDWRNAQSLGLRLVQMLSSQIDASVEAISGEGTRFEIVFRI